MYVQNLSRATPQKIRHQIKIAVQKLLKKSARGVDVTPQLFACRQLLESPPFSTSLFGGAAQRLRNAIRYLASDERGAAHYELQLLVGSLC